MGTPIDLVPDSKYSTSGHKVVWGFITILYLCHALLLYLRLRVERLYYLGTNVECFRGIDKPSHTFGFPVVYIHWHKPLGPSRSRPTSSRVAWWGGPLKFI